MKNYLTDIPENLPINSATIANNMYGDNNNQFNAPVGAINTSVTMVMVNSDISQQIQLSAEYCNIFVVKGEPFSENVGSFNIPKCKALKKNITPEISTQFCELSGTAIEQIKTFPSLFMNTNNDYKRCANPEQMFYYGIVTDIKEQCKHLKIYFRKLSLEPLLQQLLNDNSLQLGLNKNNGCDVLDETGWMIKKLDLRKALMSVGIYL